MRNIRPLALLILSLSMCTGSGVAQEHRPPPVSQLPESGLATVYVYRLDKGMVVLGFYLGFIRKTRPVYFSELPGVGPKRKNRKIAALRNKQYFMLRLPAGKYIFDTRSMRGHLEMEVAAGGEYHLWVDQGNDCPTEEPSYIGPPTCESRNASIIKVSPERWREDMSVLKPIRRGDVKDPKLVIIPPGPPSNSGAQPASGTTAVVPRQ